MTSPSFAQTSDAALHPEARARLASHWADTGRMEHASIAAFARFALQLLALGAPARLLERSHEAMADETRHARLAFGLATRYAGAPRGPGPMQTDDALSGAADDIVRLAIREGCIGETVAALEAAVARDAASDRAVCETLSVVAIDEARHAELAWQFVQWRFSIDASAVGAILRDEVSRALADGETTELAPARSRAAERDLTCEGQLAAHGYLDAPARRAIRREALLRVVAPCAQTLLASAQGTRPTAQRAVEESC